LSGKTDGPAALPKRGRRKAAQKALPAQSDPRRRSLGVKLLVIARQARIIFDQSAEQAGVTRSEWTLIAAVSHKPGVTQRTIASMLEVTDVQAGRLIDRLSAQGYLERRQNPDDRRAYCVYLTPAAQPVLERLGQLAAVHESEVFAGLDQKDLKTLDALLDVIYRNIAESRGRSCPPNNKPARGG
jgi:MarR family transcriptional regulator for hemolysin